MFEWRVIQIAPSSAVVIPPTLAVQCMFVNVPTIRNDNLTAFNLNSGGTRCENLLLLFWITRWLILPIKFVWSSSRVSGCNKQKECPDNFTSSSWVSRASSSSALWLAAVSDMCLCRGPVLAVSVCRSMGTVLTPGTGCRYWCTGLYRICMSYFRAYSSVIG